MTKALQTHVRRCAKTAPKAELAMALGALVKARLRKPVVDEVGKRTFNITRITGVAGVDRAKPQRRSARRRGRNQAYIPTSKVDVSRLGTFRHYMLKVIREHSHTWEAETAHAKCDNPKFAKNRLDFSWAAAEGYIQFV